MKPAWNTTLTAEEKALAEKLRQEYPSVTFHVHQDGKRELVGMKGRDVKVITLTRPEPA